MFKEKGIFKVNFDESAKEFGLRDGIISLIYFFYEMLVIYLFGLLIFKTNTYEEFATYFHINNVQLYKFIFYIPIVLLQLIPVFIFIKVRHQNIKSIGLKIDKTLKSIFLGVIFSLPFILPTIVNGISQGKKIMSFQDLIWLFLYFLIEIAFVEEIGFRGFIQTRIQGIIKRKWLSIVVVGIMFALMHIPFQMLNANMSLNVFIYNDWVHLITTCVLHIYFVYIYTRDNNIISSTVTHTLFDFISTIFM